MLWQEKVSVGERIASVPILLEFHETAQRKPDTSNHGRASNKSMDVGELPSYKIKVSLIRQYQITIKSEIESAKKNIKKRDNYILVACYNDKIVGFIEFFIKKNKDCFKIKKYGYLNSATTHKDYRGKGIAKALTKEALKFLKERGIIYVRTNVYNINKIAMKTWTNLGFEPQSTFLIKKIK